VRQGQRAAVRTSSSPTRDAVSKRLATSAPNAGRCSSMKGPSVRQTSDIELPRCASAQAVRPPGSPPAMSISRRPPKRASSAGRAASSACQAPAHAQQIGGG